MRAKKRWSFSSRSATSPGDHHRHEHADQVAEPHSHPHGHPPLLRDLTPGGGITAARGALGRDGAGLDEQAGRLLNPNTVG